MTPQQREKLVDALFDVIAETNAKTLKELGDNWVASTISVLKTLRNLDDETRKLLIEAIRSLAKGARKVLSERWQAKQN